MSKIGAFRINGYDNGIRESVEFYFKAHRKDNSLICNFCVADEGIYFYRKGSKILTRNETDRARWTVDGFISMDDLCDLFEALKKAGLHRFEDEREKKLSIRRKGRQVIIEEAEE